MNGLETQKLYIHGEYVASVSGNTFVTTNPATGEVLAECHRARLEDIQRAVDSAKAGFDTWSQLRGAERGRILNRAVQILRQRNEALARLEVADNGKPIREAIEVDIITGAEVIEYYAGLAATIQGTHQPLGTTNFFYTRREPLGICAGIGAWNYPIQIACWKSGIALACGNAMIYKPAEETPLTTLKLAEIYSEAGVPDGVFNVVTGGRDTGQYLVEHPDIDKVSFTGSTATGVKVLGAAASSVKNVTLELGGKSPLILFEDCKLDNAVHGALLANFYTQGEVCTNGTRVYVHDSIYDGFLEKVARLTKGIVVGDPMDPNTHMGALVSETHLNKVMGYIDMARQSGARLVCGGNRETRNGLNKGFFVQPTIFADCTDDMPHTREEIFGPVMSVMRFSDEEEVIQRANNSNYGLAAGIFTTDLSRAHRVIARLEAGICWINTYGASPAEMPVGGYKHSGIGRENGMESMQHYTQTKSVYVELGDLDTPF